MAGAPSVIRTPDQQLRVFVSSTLRELADERQAVRTAIERMRLAPVMFELGAHPHPPRELYRSYLAQTDIFVGIYADSYGWVGVRRGASQASRTSTTSRPASMPKLIYIKRDGRDRRLEQLIDRIRSDDTAGILPVHDRPMLEDRVCRRPCDPARRAFRRVAAGPRATTRSAGVIPVAHDSGAVHADDRP